MAYWLLKTDPTVYSFADLEREGRTRWDGVTNNQALIHLRSMSRGDLAFIYHSEGERSIVGTAEIVSKPYPDPKAGSSRIVVVDVAPKARLKHHVPLSAIKSRREFSDFPLVRFSRLSVMPVTGKQWELLLDMSHIESET